MTAKRRGAWTAKSAKGGLWTAKIAKSAKGGVRTAKVAKSAKEEVWTAKSRQVIVLGRRGMNGPKPLTSVVVRVVAVLCDLCSFA